MHRFSILFMKKTIPILFLLCFLSACKKGKKEKKTLSDQIENSAKPTTKTASEKVISSIEQAHQKANFLEKKAVTFTINIKSKNREELNARVSFLTNYKKIKVEKSDGTTIIYNGQKAVLFPKSNNYDRAKKDLWTWVNLFSLPFRLEQSDTGNKSEDSLHNKSYNTLRLTLKNINPNASEDHLKLYAAKTTGFITAAIFTQNSKKLLDHAQATLFKDYFSLKGVPIAKYWEFYKWNQGKGIYGDKQGEVTFSKVKFFDPPQNYFYSPKEAVSIQ